MKALTKWLQSQTKQTTLENSYVEPKRVKIQSTVDLGQGLSVNEKANHIFNKIKKMKLII